MARRRFRNIFGARQLPLDNPADESAGEPSPAVRPPAPAAEPPQAAAETVPPEGHGATEYLSSALALRDAGRLDDAETWLAEAVERFPAEPRPRIEWASLPHFRRDWAEAARRWEIVRAEFPDEALAYTLAAWALRQAGRLDEAEILAATARVRFEDDVRAAGEYAGIASDREDWPEALERWREVRNRFPETVDGYIALPAILRRLGRIEEAEEILREGIAKFPESRPLAMDCARAAETRHAWPEALERWTDLRTAFPDELVSYLGSAIALRELGRFDEADSLLVAAMERFPDEPRLRVEWALLVHLRSEWEEAARRWERVRARFPDEAIAATLGATALAQLERFQEAEELLAPARERFPNDLGVASESAWLATRRRHWAEALRRWQLVRKLFPDNSQGYTGVAMVQRELQWLDEAEAMLEEAIERFPADAVPCIDYARIAETRGDWPEAVRRWEGVRQRFPDNPSGYVFGGRILLAQGEHEPADALLTEAIQRAPDDQGALSSWADCAMRRHDWTEAARRWEQLRSRFPENAFGYVFGGRALLLAGEDDAAEILLAEAVRRYPGNEGAMSSWAESALRRRDWAEAARRSEDFRRQFPDKPFGYIAAIRALRNDGREAEAETLLFDAIARFPDDEEVRSSRTTLDPSGDQTAAGGAQAGAVLEADEEREEFIVHR